MPNIKAPLLYRPPALASLQNGGEFLRRFPYFTFPAAVQREKFLGTHSKAGTMASRRWNQSDPCRVAYVELSPPQARRPTPRLNLIEAELV
jgi:hypothetical protein